jgi:hypothetical protein
MARSICHVLRYRRLDNGRGEYWKPVGIKWQTPATDALVAHDVYHHLPGDTGTFAEEVTTFGAEYYINFEHSNLQEIVPPGLNALRRGAIAVVANVAEYAKDPAKVFHMPITRRRRLSPEAEGVFAEVAEVAYGEAFAALSGREGLEDADLEAGEQEKADVELDERTFVDSFVNLMRLGYRQARRRFPDQLRVRAAMASFELVLRHLGKRQVPVGHEITLTLKGYDCRLEYEGADVRALEGVRYVPALLMTWSKEKTGWGSEGISLHRTEDAFSDYLEGWQDEFLATGNLADQVWPDGSNHQLAQVYVTETSLIEKLDMFDSVRIFPDSMPAVGFTPSGTQVIGGLG